VSTCTLCWAVTAQGIPLAYVQETETYQAAVAQVEDAVSAVLQDDYTYPDETRLIPALVPKDQVQTQQQLTDTLMDTVDQVKAEYILSVDGVAVGACQSRDAIDQALWQVKATYATQDTVEVYFDSTVEVDYAYLPAQAEVVDAFTLADRLIQDPQEEQTEPLPASVEEDSTVPEEEDPALPVLLPLTEAEPPWEDLTPAEEEVSPDPDTPEDPLPLLDVVTVEEVTYTQALPAPVEEVEDSSLLVGQQEVRQEGIDGLEERTDRVVRCRGEEQTRETLSAVTLTQPTPQIIAVGTGQGVEGAKGRFQWPCEGRFSSPFGTRTIFGSTGFHRGTDIAAPLGTPIAAGADGVVIWSGAKGSYGNLVMVDHQNGYVTYYAHCSQLLVQVGDTVTQGQTIALVGSTGRSTGPHCHYEIRWQEEPLDPELCLS
jgi:murein DD-endopeptidase MepM/ murein hydrolase activator NlpD